MSGFLWPKELRDRWWFRFPAAVAASMVLLLAGFIVGSVWTVIGQGFTTHILAPAANSVFGIPYLGITIKVILIFMSIFTRLGMFMLVALAAMPFFANAKRRAYLLSFVPFMFYGWFFAVMYIVFA